MELTAVDLEGFKSGECIAGPVAVRIAKIEIHQNDSQFLVYGGYPIAHVRMRNDSLGSNVFTAGASTYSGHHVSILETIGVWRERCVNRIEGAADFQSDRVKLS